MSTELSETYQQELNGLRAEVERLRSDLDNARQAPSGAAARQAPAGAAAPPAGSTPIGSPIIAGQYNTAEAATMLQCTTPTITLGLLNQTPGPSTPIGLYSLVRGIGMVVSAYGAVPYPATSKAVQAFCE